MVQLGPWGALAGAPANATMAALTCPDKKTGKSVFGVATHVLTLWAVSELQQVEGLSAALRVDMKELTRAQLRAWRDEIVLKLDCDGHHEVRARSIVHALSSVLAFAHTANDTSPIRGSAMECMWSYNGWQRNQASGLLYKVRRRRRSPFLPSNHHHARARAHTGVRDKHHRRRRQPLRARVLRDGRHRQVPGHEHQGGARCPRTQKCACAC